jgi:hypothetical protein
LSLVKRVSRLEANAKPVATAARKSWYERGRNCPRCGYQHPARPDVFQGLTPEQIRRLPNEELRRLHSAMVDEMQRPFELDVPCPTCSYTRRVLSPDESAALSAEELLAAMDNDEVRPDMGAVPAEVLLQVHQLTLHGWPGNGRGSR